MGQAHTRYLELSTSENPGNERYLKGSDSHSVSDSDSGYASDSSYDSDSGSESDNFAMSKSEPSWHPITDFFKSTHAGVEPIKSVPEISLRVDNTVFYNSFYLLY